MSATLDYGAVTVLELTSKQKYRQSRKKKIIQFFLDFPNCYYCGVWLTEDNRSLDHWVPRSRGGNNLLTNLVTACQECNQEKGSQLPSGIIAIPPEAAKARKLFPCY